MDPYRTREVEADDELVVAIDELEELVGFSTTLFAFKYYEEGSRLGEVGHGKLMARDEMAP